MGSIFRDHLLENQVAFVTGGGSGIGQRMAERLAEHGATVVLAGRTQERLDRPPRPFARRAACGGDRRPRCSRLRRRGSRTAADARPLGEIDILLCGAAGQLSRARHRHVRQRLQSRHRYRPAGHLQYLPRGLSLPAQARRLDSQHLGQSRHHADRLAGARLRRQRPESNCSPKPWPWNGARRAFAPTASPREPPTIPKACGAWLPPRKRAAPSNNRSRCAGSAPKTNWPTWRCSFPPMRPPISPAPSISAMAVNRCARRRASRWRLAGR